MRAAAIVLLTTPWLWTQGTSAVLSPSPAPLGAPVTLSVTEALGVGITLPSSCLWAAIRSNSPTGPVIDAPFCLTILVPVAPCQTLTAVWNQTDQFGVPVPAGHYWFEVAYFDGGFTLRRDHYAIEVSGPPPAPGLSSAGGAVLGLPLPLTLSEPTSPFGAYFLAASLTTNIGIPVPGVGHIALDPDLLFDLSFPSPAPSLFVNFQGNLDAVGAANGIAVLIPNVPALRCRGMHLQAIVSTPLAPSGATSSNPLSFTFQ